MLPNCDASTNQWPDQFTTRKQLSWHVDYASRLNSHTGSHGPVAKLLPETLWLWKSLLTCLRKSQHAPASKSTLALFLWAFLTRSKTMTKQHKTQLLSTAKVAKASPFVSSDFRQEKAHLLPWNLSESWSRQAALNPLLARQQDTGIAEEGSLQPCSALQPREPLAIPVWRCCEGFCASGKEGLVQLRFPGLSVIVQSSQCISSFKKNN